MKRIILQIILYGIISQFLSCEAVDSPTGFIGVKDVDPPSVRILEPANNASAKDSLIVKVEIDDVTAIKNVEIFIGNGSNYSSELITRSGNIFIFKVDIAFLNGKYTLSVKATDSDNNSATNNMSVNIRSVITQIYHNKATNEVTFYSITEDKIGNIWFGSDRGLFNYANGYLEEHPYGFDLYRPVITSLAVDSKNNLWMTYDQLYAGDNTKIVAYSNSKITISDYIPRYYSPHRFCQFDVNDSLWGICLNESSFFTYKDKKWNYYDIDISFGNIQGFVIDKLNRKWLSNYKNLKYLDGSGWHNIQYPFNYGSDIIIDNQNNVWTRESEYGNSHILAKYDGTSWTTYDLSPKISDIKTFTIDKNGNIWVSANNYLWKFDSQFKVKRKYYFLNCPAKIYADSKGIIWINDEWGLYYLNESKF